MMKSLNLTNVGKFSERAGEMFSIIFEENGSVELSIGMGSRGDEIGITVMLNDSFSTVFLPKEARAIIEIITQTDSEEEPYSPRVKRVMNQIVADLGDLIAQAEKIQETRIERKLNKETRH